MSEESWHGGHACDDNSNRLLGDTRMPTVNNPEDDSTLIDEGMCVLHQRQDYDNDRLVGLFRLWNLIA